MLLRISLFLLIPCVSFSQATEKYTLNDFYIYNPVLEKRITTIMDSLSDQQLAGQMVVAAAGKYGKSNDHIRKLVQNKMVGGILLLNGEKEEFKALVNNLDSVNSANGGLPLTYSADAEPSLIKYKIKNSTPVKNADDHTSRSDVRKTAKIICDDLHYIGINYNYAPVIDISTTNEAIGNRSFGDDPDSVIVWSKEFISVTQSNNIVATAKHFPGHGQVTGDTHKKLVYIDGEMQEVNNYRPIIDAGVISIMVAHIAVKNNPEYNSDLPATLNKKIVTDLLKNKLGFKGIVITDAMGMGGVKSIPDNGVKAIKAGVDILLMPVDEEADVKRIVEEMQNDDVFRKQVYAAVRKILRLKFCLGLMK